MALERVVFADADSSDERLIGVSWEDAVPRFRSSIPDSIDELKRLWELLSHGVGVAPVEIQEPAKGVVARVSKEDNRVKIGADYRAVDLDIGETGYSGQREDPVLCLIKSTYHNFRSAEKKLLPVLQEHGLAGFDYAYVQVLNFTSDSSYELLIVPAKSGRHTTKTGALQVLHDACRMGSRNASCEDWKRSYSDAFPALAATEGIPDSATFEEVLGVLTAFARPEPGAEIDLVGFSAPVRTEALFVLVVALVVLQGYLLLAIRMLMRASAPCGTLPHVPWIALSGDHLLRAVWYVSLFVPVVSVVMVTVYALDCVGVVFFVVSMTLSIATCLKTAEWKVKREGTDSG